MLDLSALNSAQASKSREDARALLDEMLAVDSIAGKIRKASVCIDKGAVGGLISGIGGVFGGGADCSRDCTQVRKLMRTDQLDIMSVARAEQLLRMSACK